MAADETGLVRTRLRPPFRTSATVCRGRLSGAIRDGWRAVTIIKAPAGYGKSTLLAQWFEGLRKGDAAAGWLSLDRIPDDLATFFSYAVSALRMARPDFGQHLAFLFGSAGRPTVRQVTAAIVNAIAEIEEEVFLFVDDFHLVDDTSVAAVFSSILNNPPQNFHLVMATRHSPPFSLSALRSKGGLAEFDEEWLRFDSGETAELLRRAGQGNLSAANVETIVARTEGWPAGIRLASLSLSKKNDPDSFLSFLSGSHHHLAAYLADDVLNNQDEQTVEFLLKTSILSRLCPSLCDAVTGSGDGRRQLDALEGQSLFLCTLDSERQWYRYHHLFAAFLRKRLEEREPGIVASLHLRASAWFAGRGFLEEAFSHGIDADAPMRAGELLDRSCTTLFYGGRLSTLLRFSSRIPPAVLRNYPRARLEIAWSLILEWRFDAAAKILADIEDTLADGSLPTDYPIDRIMSVLAHRKMMLSHFMDDIKGMETALFRMIGDFPDDDPYLRGNLESCLIYARRESYQLNNFDRLDAKAREFYEKSGSMFVLVWHETIVGPTYFLRGDTELAESTLRTAITVAHEVDGGHSALSVMPSLLLAEVLYEMNNCREAEDIIENSSGEAEKQGLVDQLVAYYVTKARLLVRRGEVEAARNVLRQGRASAERHGFLRLRRHVDLEEVSAAIKANDVATLKAFLAEQAEPYLEEALKPGNHTTTGHEALALAWSKARCATGEFAQAIQVLRRWIAFVGGRGAVRSKVRLLVALAVAAARDGREGEALRCLRDAVKEAARPRLIRTFIEEGAAVETLLQKLFGGRVEVADQTTVFGLQLIRAFDAEKSDDVDDQIACELPEDDAEGMLVPEQMNGREGEIIKLVAAGLSNKEIGIRLGLTEGSIKWYLQAIFAKLGVRRRSMAVLKARKFGII